MAEREGFEPSVRLLAQHLSRVPHSTALASLRVEISLPVAKTAYARTTEFRNRSKIQLRARV